MALASCFMKVPEGSVWKLSERKTGQSELGEREGGRRGGRTAADLARRLRRSAGQPQTVGTEQYEKTRGGQLPVLDKPGKEKGELTINASSSSTLSPNLSAKSQTAWAQLSTPTGSSYTNEWF